MQWFLSSLKQKQAFEEQSQHAKDEIYDRFMQYYHLKQDTFHLQRLLANHTCVHTLDASLTAQSDLMLDLTQMWPLFQRNMEQLGQRLEACLNQLALGVDVVVEDSGLMVEQVGEIGRQLARANEVMKNNQKYSAEMQGKLEKLQGVITVECEYLGQLQQLVRERREKMIQENSQKIDEVLKKREQNVIEAATTNTFANLLQSKA
ncbi:hypothetical protein FGO68_gene2349 [Halteria grandinella]|uniref:Uncharacterized protein n=1 Tax=Halteria grandinella TaxID=5974 RepID=A0A8J8T0E0_HALGN|nr:hypothetical protein FGO68_gene2349 [Halteria grandinella]